MYQSPKSEAKIIAISKAGFTKPNQQNDALLMNCVKDLQDIDTMINAYLGNCDQI